jgi:hypothetical protein
MLSRAPNRWLTSIQVSSLIAARSRLMAVAPASSICGFIPAFKKYRTQERSGALVQKILPNWRGVAEEIAHGC